MELDVDRVAKETVAEVAKMQDVGFEQAPGGCGGGGCPAGEEGGSSGPGSTGDGDGAGGAEGPQAGQYTEADVTDGHSHAVASIDLATGVGVTEVVGGEGTGIRAHAHAIVAGVVQVYSAFGYTSDHGGMLKGIAARAGVFVPVPEEITDEQIAQIAKAIEEAFARGGGALLVNVPPDVSEEEARQISDAVEKAFATGGVALVVEGPDLDDATVAELRASLEEHLERLRAS